MIVLTTGIILILFSLIFAKRLKMPLGFLFVLLIMGFQGNIESDYIQYKEDFETLSIIRTADDEPFWGLLNQLFHPFGWYVFVFILALFECYVFYKLVFKYSNKRFVWLAPILYYFTFGMMCEQMNTMRQSLAIAICLLPFLFDNQNNNYRKKHRWLYYAVPLVLAFLTHNSSAVMLIPFSICYFINKKKTSDKVSVPRTLNQGNHIPVDPKAEDSMLLPNHSHPRLRKRRNGRKNAVGPSDTGCLQKYIPKAGELYNSPNYNGRSMSLTLPVAVLSLVLSTYFLKTYILDDLFIQLSSLTVLSDVRIAGYLAERKGDGDIFNQSWLIVFYDAVMAFLSSIVLQKTDGTSKVLVLMSIIGYFLDVLLFGMGTMPRIGYYFIVANIVTIPLVCDYILKKYGRVIVSVFIVFCLAYSIKTSLPYMLSDDWCCYGNYRFVFMM